MYFVRANKGSEKFGVPSWQVEHALIQGDQKVSVHLMITVQKKTRKDILNSFSHLP
jgi:hypothetical protein